MPELKLVDDTMTEFFNTIKMRIKMEIESSEQLSQFIWTFQAWGDQQSIKNLYSSITNFIQGSHQSAVQEIEVESKGSFWRIVQIYNKMK